MYYDELMPKVQNQHDTQSSHNDYFVFTYSLATIIGCEAAMVLSRIEYLINVSGKKLIGRKGKWICNSYESWQKQFPNLSYYKIKKIFRILEKDGFIISTKANASMKDHTKWYTVVKEKFEQYKHIKNANKSMKQSEVN